MTTRGAIAAIVPGPKGCVDQTSTARRLTPRRNPLVAARVVIEARPDQGG
jgi:hypothetical protein